MTCVSMPSLTAGSSAFTSDNKGLEVDAIVERVDGRWIGVEVKLGHNRVEDGAETLIRLRKKLSVEVNEACAGLMVVVADSPTYTRLTESSSPQSLRSDPESGGALRISVAGPAQRCPRAGQPRQSSQPRRSTGATGNSPAPIRAMTAASASRPRSIAAASSSSITGSSGRSRKT